jgi:crotonobetainyl-CoA:carnitine CoA-transferase CaiB-like acyl-CoA transferase
MTDPQVAHNGTFVEFDHPSEGHVKMPGFPIRFSRTPSRVMRGAPQVGEHSREVLLEAGFSNEAIEKLVSCGTVRQD